MKLLSEWTSLDAGRPVPAYAVRPAAARGVLPAVLVVQEIWGVDEHIRDVSDRLAAAGYQALAPDLWADGGRRPECLTPERIELAKAFVTSLPAAAWADPEQRRRAMAARPEPERGHLEETFGRLMGPEQGRAERFARYVEILKAGFRHLRAPAGAEARPVASVGFCLGGGLSALLACEEPGLAAAVVYYGQTPDPARLPAIGCPVLGLYGGKDARVTDAVPAFASAMRAAGKSFQAEIYPDAPHAFFNDTRPTYRVDAARLAWACTLGFLARHVGGRPGGVPAPGR